MRTESGIRDRCDAWANRDALAIARGPWGGVGGPATASSRRGWNSATVSGLQHMGIAGGRRRAGAPRGTAGTAGTSEVWRLFRVP